MQTAQLSTRHSPDPELGDDDVGDEADVAVADDVGEAEVAVADVAEEVADEVADDVGEDVLELCCRVGLRKINVNIIVRNRVLFMFACIFCKALVIGCLSFFLVFGFCYFLCGFFFENFNLLFAQNYFLLAGLWLETWRIWVGNF